MRGVTVSQPAQGARGGEQAGQQVSAPAVSRVGAARRRRTNTYTPLVSQLAHSGRQTEQARRLQHAAIIATSAIYRPETFLYLLSALVSYNLQQHPMHCFTSQASLFNKMNITAKVCVVD